VDCIEIVTQPEPLYDAEVARQRFNARKIRLLRDEQEKQQAYRDKRRLAALTSDQQQDKEAKQDYILQALARKQSKGVYGE
jgi:electron transport complex protein RnfB